MTTLNITNFDVATADAAKIVDVATTGGTKTDTVKSGVRILRTGPRGLGNPTSDFAGLLNTVRDAGLLRRHRLFYVANFLIVTVAMAAAWVGFAYLRGSWFELALAGAMGVLLTQYAFMGHESAHRQVWQSARANDFTARLLCDLVVGMSYSWWMNKHSRHHASPNTVDRDPDIEKDFLVFQEKQGARVARDLRLARSSTGLDLFPRPHARGPQSAHAGVPHRPLARPRRQARARDRAVADPQRRICRGSVRLSATRDGIRLSRCSDGRLRRLHGAHPSPRTTRECRRFPPTRGSTSFAAR